MVRLPVTINASSFLFVFSMKPVHRLRKTSPLTWNTPFCKLLDSRLVTLAKSTQVFSKYLGFSMYPACWAHVHKRHSILPKLPATICKCFPSHVQNCLTLLDVFGLNESMSTTEEKTEKINLSTLLKQHAHD